MKTPRSHYHPRFQASFMENGDLANAEIRSQMSSMSSLIKPPSIDSLLSQDMPSIDWLEEINRAEAEELSQVG